MTLQALRRDQRGMILIVAIPMAAVAVGCMFYVISMWDVMSYRERLQDVADATAFESAVLHARAMNAAVQLNALVTALWSLSGLVRALTWVGIAAVSVSSSAQPVLHAALEAESRSMPRIEAALQIVEETRRALNETAPLVASSIAAAQQRDFYRRGDSALALSYALLPTSEHHKLAADPMAPWLLTPRAGDDWQPRFERDGLHIASSSLPFSSAPVPLLCEHAQRNASAMPQDAVEQFLEGASAGAQARAWASQLRLPLQAALVTPLCGGQPPPVLATAVAGYARSLGGGFGVPSAITPEARNGNALMQIWSIARAGTLRHEARDERALKLVSLERPVDVAPADAAFSQAEFFFDCQADWSRCAADAAWSPRWSARLRRYERPDGELGVLRTAAVAGAFLQTSPALDRAIRSLAPERAWSAQQLIARMFEQSPCGRERCIH